MNYQTILQTRENTINAFRKAGAPESRAARLWDLFQDNASINKGTVVCSNIPSTFWDCWREDSEAMKNDGITVHKEGSHWVVVVNFYPMQQNDKWEKKLKITQKGED